MLDDRIVEGGSDHEVWRRLVERQLRGQDFVKDQAQAEYIAAFVDGVAGVELLGRGVATDVGVVIGEGEKAHLGEHPRQAEVRDLDAAFRRDDDAFRPQGLVQDAGAMRVLHAQHHLAQERHRGSPSRGGVGALEVEVERDALHEFCREVGVLVRVADVVDQEDIGVVELRKAARLDLELLDEDRILGEDRIDHLERDGAVHAKVGGQVQRTQHIHVENAFDAMPVDLQALTHANMRIHANASYPCRRESAAWRLGGRPIMGERIGCSSRSARAEGAAWVDDATFPVHAQCARGASALRASSDRDCTGQAGKPRSAFG